jgi:hypothetical protein
MIGEPGHPTERSVRRMHRDRRRDRLMPRTCRPSVEGLEVRELLSASSLHAGSHPGATVRARTPAAVEGARPRTGPVNPALIPGFLQTLYGPVTTTVPIQIGNQVFPPGTYAVPQPTGAEIRRQSFTERFVGRYYVGPPRFSNQAATIKIYSNGKNVTSNQFRTGRAEIVLFPPADPGAQPTTSDPVAGRIAGLATTFPANTLQTGNVLFLDLTNLPGVASNDPVSLNHGLPAHLSFTFDALSGGVYSAPEFQATPPIQTNAETGAPIFPLLGGSGGAVSVFSTGTGVVNIRYIPDPHPRPGTSGSGMAIVTVQGLINNTGTLYAEAKQIN